MTLNEPERKKFERQTSRQYAKHAKLCTDIFRLAGENLSKLWGEEWPLMSAFVVTNYG